jgi:hypothetical protein
MFIKIIALPIMLGVLGHRYYNHHDHETSYDQFKNDIDWSLARVPNINELITMSYPLAIANMIIEPFIERLYQINPIAKAVIRDWTKIPSNIAAWWNENEIGGTHVKYDEGNVYGGITKIACKSSIIGIHANFNHGLGEGDLEKISRISNYICEPTSRIYNLLSKEKQMQNITDINYFEFAIKNIDTELLLQATAEGLTKNTVADQVGSFFGKLGVFQFLKTIYVTVENKFISHTVDAIAGGNLLHHRITAVHAATPNQHLKKVAIISALIGVDFILKTVAEGVTSFIITPTVRIAQDSIGNIIKVGWEYWDHKKSNITKSIEKEVDKESMRDLDDVMPLHPVTEINNDTNHDEL